MPQITIHENKEDYTPAEAAELAQAFAALEVKAQGGTLTIEETRIRIAYIRYKREDNFKIAVLPERKKKDPGVKKVSTRKPKVKQVESSIQKASKLLFKQNKGEVLTEDEQNFLVELMSDPPEL